MRNICKNTKKTFILVTVPYFSIATWRPVEKINITIIIHNVRFWPNNKDTLLEVFRKLIVKFTVNLRRLLTV